MSHHSAYVAAYAYLANTCVGLGDTCVDVVYATCLCNLTRVEVLLMHRSISHKRTRRFWTFLKCQSLHHETAAESRVSSVYSFQKAMPRCSWRKPAPRSQMSCPHKRVKRKRRDAAHHDSNASPVLRRGLLGKSITHLQRQMHK